MSYRTSIINGQTVAILAKAFYLFQMLLNDDKGGLFRQSVSTQDKGKTARPPLQADALSAV